MTGPVGAGAPPGWYPAPGDRGALRWWDGARWSEHVAAAAGPSGPPARQTDGFAIASLVLGILGPSLLAIVFGFVARGRIDRSPDTRQGRGFATAGIVLGFLWLALQLTIAVLLATGAFDEPPNAARFAGEEAEVAAVVDELEAAFEDDRLRLRADVHTRVRHHGRPRRRHRSRPG